MLAVCSPVPHRPPMLKSKTMLALLATLVIGIVAGSANASAGPAPAMTEAKIACLLSGGTYVTVGISEACPAQSLAKCEVDL